MKTYGISDFIDCVKRTFHPRYGAEEDAAWNRHLAWKMALAFGCRMTELAGPEAQAWGEMQRLCEDRPPHPLSGFLEASLLVRIYGEALAPVHETYQELMDIRQQELLRLAGIVFGEVTEVDHDALLALGLDTSLVPNWPEIYDRL